MTPTKFQLKRLERALDRAAKLSNLHAEAVKVAENVFAETFGVVVPEELGRGAFPTSKENVGSLFNDIANHGENMAGDNVTTAFLVERMAELMNMDEDEL